MKLPILAIMFLIMFALKLAGPMASVSWWVITLPLWAPFAALAVVFIVALIVKLIATCLTKYN